MKTRKVKVILLSLALIMVMAISGTLAFITASSNDVNNTFEPGRVSCKVNENFNGTEKTDVTIINTGNVRAYIRAEIVVTWQNENGDVYGKPVAQNEYDLNIGNQWQYNEADGFYYYPFIAKLLCTGQYLLSLAHYYYLIPCNTHFYPHFNKTALSMTKQKFCLHITFKSQL